MNITLFDINPKLCESWKSYFDGCEDVSIINSSLEDLPGHDCLVTAGNSFGAMSGGIDLAVRNLMGFGAQDYIQMEIMRLFPYGMPLGDVLCVVDERGFKFNKLIYAPVMRIPSRARLMDITYVTMVVISSALKDGAESIAIPGIGTGCGGMKEPMAAKAMRAGYDAAKYLLSEAVEPSCS